MRWSDKDGREKKRGCEMQKASERMKKTEMEGAVAVTSEANQLQFCLLKEEKQIYLLPA